MIAAGLALMGGCFAQDEMARCVETYWPAEKIIFPADYPIQTLFVTFDVYGGDSASDEFYLKGVFDLRRSDYFKEYRIFIGMHASQKGSFSWNEDGIWWRTATNDSSVEICAGKLMQRYNASFGSFESLAKNEKMKVRVNNGAEETFSYKYTVGDAPRPFRLYPDYLREFVIAHYRNKQTGTEFLIYPMQSVSGGIGAWDVKGCVLTEA